MATQSRIGIQTDINANVANNTTADISPTDVRNILTDINDSSVNKTTDTNLIGWYPFDATKNYYNGELVIYSGNLYQFNQNHTAGAWNTAHADLYACTGATTFQASVSLSSAEILALNGTPKTAITCPAGKTIRVMYASCALSNNITPYLTDKDLILITNGANIPQVKWTNVLDTFGANQHRVGAVQSPSFIQGDVQLLHTADLLITTPTANPTAGNLSASVYITFTLL